VDITRTEVGFQGQSDIGNKSWTFARADCTINPFNQPRKVK
jgi:hypothetical protein